jgi:outer membrane immunogenic protein
MKKLFLLGLVLTLCLSGFSQFKFKGIGGGLALGSKAGMNSSLNDAMGFGINIFGLAGIKEKIDIEAGIDYFLPSSQKFMTVDIKKTFMTINVNGHYNFLSADALKAYGLVGLGLGMVTAEAPNPLGGTISSSDAKIGLNLGAGADYKLTDNISAIGQIGYTAGGADQLFIHAGVVYLF